MKKIKLKFKRALFAFFKEEILNTVGYQKPFKQVEIKHSYLNVQELRADIILNNDPTLGKPLLFEFEEAVYRAKEELFKESLKYCVVDSHSIFNPDIYNKTAIKVSLFIGTK